jgi:D-serine deaminase-like pyridoxal phosphate-dependent protein
MERPVFQPVGTPVEDLDTPALVVDLATMERNIEVVHSYFRQADAKLRPHVASHQCPQVAHRQLEAGGTSNGVSVTTVGEAEVFADAGFSNILVASEIVTRAKILRLCALARRNRIAVAVDNPKNVDDLARAAQASGVTLQVLIEIDAGRGLCGVSAGDPAIKLAQQISGLDGLSFGGLMALLPPPQYAGDAGAPDHASLDSQVRRQIQPVLDTREGIEKAGLEVPTVSIGGTHSYDIAGLMSGVTEVQAGGYPLMDYSSCQMRPEFTPAAKVLAQVISHPVAGRAVLDAGHKATGPDLGVPVLEGFSGAEATRFSAEHGILELEEARLCTKDRQQLKPGDKAWLVPFHLGLCLNQYDYIRAVQGGKLEGFWPLPGRGRFD